MILDSGIKHLGYLEPLDLENYDPCWHKNVSLIKGIDHPLMSEINYLASLLSNVKRRVFDLKIQDLKDKEVPCIPGWHLDSGPDIPAEYVLMTAGVSRTEFFLGDVEVSYNENMKILCNEIQKLNLEANKKLQDFEIIRYTNTSIHRGTPATNSGRRLLIRVMGYK